MAPLAADEAKSDTRVGCRPRLLALVTGAPGRKGNSGRRTRRVRLEGYQSVGPCGQSCDPTDGGELTLSTDAEGTDVVTAGVEDEQQSSAPNVACNHRSVSQRLFSQPASRYA
jgi:hypothetical protein